MSLKVEGLDSFKSFISDLSKTVGKMKQEVKETESKSRTHLGKDLQEALILAIEDPQHGKSAAEKLLKEFNMTQKEAADKLAEHKAQRVISKLSEVK